MVSWVTVGTTLVEWCLEGSEGGDVIGYCWHHTGGEVVEWCLEGSKGVMSWTASTTRMGRFYSFIIKKYCPVSETLWKILIIYLKK